MSGQARRATAAPAWIFTTRPVSPSASLSARRTSLWARVRSLGAPPGSRRISETARVRRGTVSSRVPNRLTGPKATPGLSAAKALRAAFSRAVPSWPRPARSMTTSPPKPFRRSSRAVSAMAVRLSWRTRDFGSGPFRGPRSTSTATRARVVSITTRPPPGRTWASVRAASSAASAIRRASAPVTVSRLRVRWASRSATDGPGESSRTGASAGPTPRTAASLPGRGAARTSTSSIWPSTGRRSGG